MRWYLCIRAIRAGWHPLSDETKYTKTDFLLSFLFAIPIRWWSIKWDCLLLTYCLNESSEEENFQIMYLWCDFWKNLNYTLSPRHSKNDVKNVFSLYQNVSPSTSSTLSSNSAAVITKAITGTLPLQQQMHFVNVEAQHLQNENKQSESAKHLEVALLRVEQGGLRNQLGCPRVGNNPFCSSYLTLLGTSYIQ